MLRHAALLTAFLLAAGGPAAAEGSADSAARLAETLDRLAAFFSEDAAAAAGSIVDLATEQALRESLVALVEAAAAEGLGVDQVERRLAFAATRRFGRAVPDLLRDANGRLDVRLLLAGVGVGVAAPGRSGERDYLRAISAEGSATEVSGGRVAPAAAPAEASAAETLAGAGDSTAAPAPEGRLYPRDGIWYTRVRPGDTLTGISAEVYGDLLGYRRINVENRDVLLNPNLLEPGLELKIPR